MKIQSLLFILLFVFLGKNISSAQESKFQGGLIAGLNASQLEGENLTDYLGINAGVFASRKLSRRIQVGIEFLFSQNGEYILPDFYPKVEYGKIWLNHIEVPLHFDWLFNFFKHEKGFDSNVNFGLAYAKLISYSAEDINKVDITDQIIYGDKDTFLFQLGWTVAVSDRIGINTRISIPVRKKELDATMALRIIYTIKQKSSSEIFLP